MDTIPPEPPNHLLIGTDNTHLAEYDKALQKPEYHEARYEESSKIAEKQQLPANHTKPEKGESENTSKYIYRVEYRDSTGTVIAVRKGTTPPVHSSDQGDNAPVFELIKRVRVIAKAGTSTETKTKQDTSPATGKSTEIKTKQDTSPATGKDDGAETKPNIEPMEVNDKPDTLKDKNLDAEDEKLKDFDISPESTTTWSLKILSEYLMNALRAVVEYYPGLQLLSHDVEFEEPYRELIHHMDQLEHYKDNQDEDHPPEYQTVCKGHIDELLKYLRHKFGEKLKDEYARHQRVPPVCTFPYLWLIFKPGEEVYWNWGSSQAFVSSFIVDQVSGGISGDSRPSSLRIHNWGLDYYGDKIVRVEYCHTVKPFDGEKPIQELKIYPARFHRDDPKGKNALPRKEQFVENGKQFFQLCQSKGHYRWFRGRSIAGKLQKAVIQARVVVDQDQYFEDKGLASQVKSPFMASYDSDSDDEDDTTARTGCLCTHCHKRPSQKKGRDWTEYDNVSPAEPPPTDDLFYRLCHVIVPAYLLKDRKWELVHVSDLHSVSFNENLLDLLVLPMNVKNTVKALAWNASQKTLDSFSADFIEGKGNGQIILLHGAPGVGKTATAGKLLVPCE
jgi:flagellar biosynthesis GTPase FlhF